MTTVALLQGARMDPSDLVSLINAVHGAIVALEESTGAGESAERPAPAVPVSESVTQDYILCLEDGCACRSLARHLKQRHGLTPDAYRARWGLDSDYPMTPKNYLEARRNAAIRNGFGSGRRSRFE